MAYDEDDFERREHRRQRAFTVRAKVCDKDTDKEERDFYVDLSNKRQMHWFNRTLRWAIMNNKYVEIYK